MRYLIIFLFLLTLSCTSQVSNNENNKAKQVLQWALRLNGVNK